MSVRLPISKTPKCYVGGAFIRSESGRVSPIHHGGEFFAHVPRCTRKDLRNAVEAAAKAGPGWAGRTPYNRGQILYRLGEMIESRAGEMAERIAQGTGCSSAEATAETNAAIDRLIYFAGWCDKFSQVLGAANPVSGPFFNFTICEPMGVIGVIADDRCPLLGLVSQIAPILVGGSTVVALASETVPYPSILLGEMLAVSDLPGGVINLLTGQRAELVPTFATHAHLRGVDAVVSAADAKTLATGCADSVKRCKIRPPSVSASDWLDARHESAECIRDFVEFKTVWHPIGA
ncbi:MAG: aldehyde dehydrogenase [Verrucomicrobia bacterium]|nr:aldehyde dehydrogenase [Verrucomicrobiota bacterium]